MSKVFVFGYYGYYNMGDEASLGVTVDMIRKSAPDAEIDVLSYQSEATSEEFGVRGISRNHLMSILKSIHSSDLVIAGGGSLLQNVTSNRSLYYYLVIIAVSKFFRKPVVFFSNGFGPILGSRGATRRMVNKVDSILVRDDSSLALMRSVGITADISVTADVTFDLTPPAVKKEEDRRIIVALRSWPGEERYLDGISSALAGLAAAGYEIVFLPMNLDADVKIVENIKSKFPQGIALNTLLASGCDEVLENIARADIVIGMRLHSLIFGLVCGIPVIGLDYDPKVAALAQDFGMPLISLEIGDISRGITEAVKTVEDHYDEMCRDIKEKSRKKREALSLNMKVLDSYLKK